MRALVLSLCLSGCLLFESEDPDDLVSRCQGEARAAHYVGGASVEDALQIYNDCIKRGL
jgi:hypothetical protein